MIFPATGSVLFEHQRGVRLPEFKCQQTLMLDCWVTLNSMCLSVIICRKGTPDRKCLLHAAIGRINLSEPQWPHL